MTLTSPLGTAGVRGTMFQMMAVRNPVTGDISGGINLISGDIEFSGIDGNEVSLVSVNRFKWPLQIGRCNGFETGGLIDLTSTYGPALTGNSLPPTIDQIFPGFQEDGDGESSSVSSLSSFSSLGDGDNWELVLNWRPTSSFRLKRRRPLPRNFHSKISQTRLRLTFPNPLCLLPPFQRFWLADRILQSHRSHLSVGIPRLP